MKKLLRIAASLILVVCICTNTMITSFANNNNDSSVSDFPYDNASNYVADCISKGIINMDGTATSTPYVSLAILHEYTYQNLAEALIDDPLLTFDSAFWKNIGLVLDADFTNCVNWQKNLYIALIMDYLNYSEKDDAYKSNLDKKTQEFGEEIIKQVLEYADSEYLKNVDDLIENQSLTDAVNFSNKYGYINEINEYNTLADDINKVSKSAFEYYENLSKALAVQSVNKSRIEFLEQMKEAGSDNKYFVEAIDEVISAYEATFSKIAFSEGCSTMLDFAVKECFGFLENSIPELKLIFKGLKVYTSGLDWLFNSDDISDNNLKILLLYTMGSYTFTALNSLRDTYASNPTTENAEAFIGGFFSFLKYHEYATSNTYGFISSTIFDGISNNIKNIFSNENQVKYETFKEYLDYDIKFSQKLRELVNKLYSIYFSMESFNDGEGNESIFSNDYDSPENATEIDENFNQLQEQETIRTTSDERDIVLVLDTSGSMSGNPMEETKKAAINFVNTILEEDASIGVVNYEDSAQELSDFSINKNYLTEIVADISSGGGTNIEAGLAEAKSMLNSSNAKKKIIVLMSDGEPNSGKEGEDLIAYADEIKNDDILIYTLGFFENMGGSKSTAQYLMEQLASDGCHYEVASADDLIFFFEDMADQINGQKYIYIRIACPVDVSVTYNGETLCSAEGDLNVRTDFGTLTFEDNENVADTDKDERIKVLRLKEGVDYNMQIVGTGRGMMDYTIGFMDENGDYNDFRRFEDVKISKQTVIDTVAAVSDESILNIDEDGDGKYDLKLRAEENGYGEEVKISGWLYVSICGGVALLVVIALIVVKTRKSKKKGMVNS